MTEPIDYGETVEKLVPVGTKSDSVENLGPTGPKSELPTEGALRPYIEELATVVSNSDSAEKITTEGAVDLEKKSWKC